MDVNSIQALLLAQVVETGSPAVFGQYRDEMMRIVAHLDDLIGAADGTVAAKAARMDAKLIGLRANLHRGISTAATRLAKSGGISPV